MGDHRLQAVPEPDQLLRKPSKRRLGSNRSRGYCPEMICADFLAGANLDNGDPETRLFSMTRFFNFLPGEQRQVFLGSLDDKPSRLAPVCTNRHSGIHLNRKLAYILDKAASDFTQLSSSLMHDGSKPRRRRWPRWWGWRSVMSFTTSRSARVDILARLKDCIAGPNASALVPEISRSAII